MVAEKKTPSNQNPKSPLSTTTEEYRYETSPDWQTSSEDSTTFPTPEDMVVEDALQGLSGWYSKDDNWQEIDTQQPSLQPSVNLLNY